MEGLGVLLVASIKEKQSSVYWNGALQTNIYYQMCYEITRVWCACSTHIWLQLIFKENQFSCTYAWSLL